MHSNHETEQTAKVLVKFDKFVTNCCQLQLCNRVADIMWSAVSKTTAFVEWFYMPCVSYKPVKTFQQPVLIVNSSWTVFEQKLPLVYQRRPQSLPCRSLFNWELKKAQTFNMGQTLVNRSFWPSHGTNICSLRGGSRNHKLPLLWQKYTTPSAFHPKREWTLEILTWS